MQSFIQYLECKKRTYSYKIKLAGDYVHTKEQFEFMLEQFKLVKISDLRRTPVQECTLDFPMVKNTCVTILDIEISYPTTPQVLTSLVVDRIGIPECCILVLPTNDFSAEYIDTRTETSSNQPECKDPQSHVSQRRISDLLKSLQSGNFGVSTTGDKTPEIEMNNISPIGYK